MATAYTYELKNMSKIKIKNGELIIGWESNTRNPTELRFALDEIENIGIILKSTKED